MRKIAILAAMAAFLGTAGAASAGGMYEGSLKDAPLAPLPATWTGFYIGAGVGAGAVVHELDIGLYEPEVGELAGLNFDGIGGEGILGTVQVGYDWQVMPRWVVGAFVDFDWSGLSTELDFNLRGDGVLRGDGELEMDYMWTIGGRIGYLPTPDTLVYILAGYTQAEFDDPSITLSYGGESETFGTSLDTFSGWTVGVGMETRLDSNWGLKLEYRFTQLNDEELFSVVCYYCELSADLEPSIHTGRVVVTYRLTDEAAPLEPLK